MRSGTDLPGQAASPSRAEQLARAESVLRDRGLRVTQPRVAVLAGLATLGGHPTADEIVAALAPAVHRATVYRTLDTLLELSLVTHVHLDSGATAYHVADRADQRPHLHARCRDCGCVVDLPPDLLDEAAAGVLRLTGFELDAHHIALSGQCRSCLETAGTDPAG